MTSIVVRIFGSRDEDTMMSLFTKFALVVALVFLETFTIYAQTAELVIQTGHSNGISSVAITPDGTVVASGSGDNTVKLWETATGKELRTLSGHADGVKSIAIDSAGKLLASGSFDFTIKLWSITTGQLIRTLSVPQVHLRDDQVWSVAFSPGGERLAAGYLGGKIRLWDTTTGHELSELSGHDNGFASVAFSPDGRVLASGGGDGRIKLWNTRTGQEIRTVIRFTRDNPFPGYPIQVNSLSFSSDGKSLACSTEDFKVRTLNIISGRESLSVNVRPSTAFRGGFALSADGNKLAGGGADGSIGVWNVRTGAKLISLTANGGVNALAFSPDSKTLVGGDSSGSVQLWSIDSGEGLWPTVMHSAGVSAVDYNANQKLVASADRVGRIKLWNIDNPNQVQTLKSSQKKRITSIAFSPEGKLLASASGSDTVDLFDVTNNSLLQSLKTKHDTDGVAFSGNGRMIASCSPTYAGQDKEQPLITVWSVPTGRVLRTFPGFCPMQFSTDSTLLFGVTLEDRNEYDVSVGGRVNAWNVLTGRKMQTFITPKQTSTGGGDFFINTIALSSDGRSLAASSSGVDGNSPEIGIWDVSSARKVQTLRGNSNTIESIAFGKDGKTLFGGSRDKTILLWNLATGKQLKKFGSHSAAVTSITFGPGNTLLSGGDDAKTTVSDIASGNDLITLIALDENDWVSVAPDGRFDGSENGMKLIYYVQDNKPIPLDAFFERFYTPKLLARVLSGSPGEPKAPTASLSKSINLPPLVHITSPQRAAVFGEDSLVITVEAKDQGGGVEDIRLYQNGKLVSDDTRQLNRETAVRTRTFEVILIPGVNTFRATAFNSDRTEATPDEIKIELKAVEASSNLFILAIGLNDYKNTRYNLNYGRADAQAIADAIEQRGRSIFKDIKKRVIFDAEATRGNIEAAFREIIKQAKPQDAFVFYYAGHGVMSESYDKDPADFYLVPYEVVRIYGDDGSLSTNGIAARNLRELLKNVRAQKQLIILDACESGGALETIAMRGASEEKAIMQLARSAGVAVLASAGQDQVATEFGKLGHGVFTYALLKGLSGEADGAPKDGKVTIKELEAYINDQVPELTKLYRGKRQDPNSWTRGQDFPIAIR